MSLASTIEKALGPGMEEQILKANQLMGVLAELDRMHAKVISAFAQNDPQSMHEIRREVLDQLKQVKSESPE